MFRKKTYPLSIFLDLDGPLLDVSERHFFVYKKIVENLGGNPIDKKRYWFLKRNKINMDTLIKKSGLAKAKKGLFKNCWLKMIERRDFLAYDSKWPWAEPCLNELRKKYGLNLITLRKSYLNLMWQLKKTSIKHFFDKILCGNWADGWRVKYDLIKECNLSTNKTLIIGDTEVDLLAGKKARIPTVALLCGLRNKKNLIKYAPDFIFPSLKEAMTAIDKYAAA